MSSSIAYFPFNSLVLLFGTEANAAYHIGRRIYQQFTGPVYRTLGTVTSIIVGQTLGEGKLDEAQFAAKGILIFSVVILVCAGIILFLGAEQLVGLFTPDPTTSSYAVEFTRTFAVSMGFMGIFFPLAGALRGAGDTRIPFYSRLIGVFVFLLGVSYFLSITFEYGLLGIYVGIILSYLCWAIIVWAGFRWGRWQQLATVMMSERAEIDS
jgi:Na+-driven multidrug efflux pump